jgi:hypothetical protein
MSKKKKITCGIIMPISSIEDYSSDHWVEVKNIITESIKSIEEYTIEIKLVSDADDIGVIQKRIVQNIYNSDIVICDVSAKNPNVMFELGMRLAFDKPTIIIKDDKTGYSFDTGLIEHIDYPKDLRFSKIINFKNKLANSVLLTYKKSEEDPEHSTFLKNFGQFHIANLTENTIPADKMIIEMLSDLQTDVNRLRRRNNTTNHRSKNKQRPLSKILDSIKRFKSEKSLNTMELLNNQDFYTYIENDINASNIYQTEEEFKDDIDSILTDII